MKPEDIQPGIYPYFLDKEPFKAVQDQVKAEKGARYFEFFPQGPDQQEKNKTDHDLVKRRWKDTCR